MKVIISLSALFFSVFSFAATEFKATGHSEIAAEPDFFSINVTVKSQCYDTARNAGAANAVFVNTVLEELVKYTGAEGTSVSNTGLSLYRDNLVDYDNGSRKTLCEGFFAVEKVTLVATAEDIKNYPEIVYAIQDLLDAQSSSGPQNLTTLTLSQPNPFLSHATRIVLEKQALAKATENALDNLEAIATESGKNLDGDYEIKVSELHDYRNSRSKYEGDLATAPGSGSGSTAPTPQFSTIWIKKTVEATATAVGEVTVSFKKDRGNTDVYPDYPIIPVRPEPPFAR